ncbi:MAG: hypothetical protein WBG11_07585, partial [Methylocella sp.]
QGRFKMPDHGRSVPTASPSPARTTKLRGSRLNLSIYLMLGLSKKELLNEVFVHDRNRRMTHVSAKLY